MRGVEKPEAAMKQLYLFATRADISAVLADVAAVHPVTFHLYGNYFDRDDLLLREALEHRGAICKFPTDEVAVEVERSIAAKILHPYHRQ